MTVELLPAEIGLPPKFTIFRPDQFECIETALYSPERFIVLCAPTGMGKSVIARSISLISSPSRTAIVTSTKGLADQYQYDFGSGSGIGKINQVANRILGPGAATQSEILYDIRGKNNYQCVEKKGVGCDDGPKLGCSKPPGLFCPYHDALNSARHAQALNTNYSLWMHINKPTGKGTGGGAGTGKGGLSPIIGKRKPIDILILDEAHVAPDELTKFLAVRVGEKEVKALLGDECPDTEDIDEWVNWAKPWGKWCADEVKDWSLRAVGKPFQLLEQELPNMKKLENLGKRLEGIANTVRDGWVCEEKTQGRGKVRTWEFEPIFPGQYAESTLFCGVPKVILVSATVRRKTMVRLGVKSLDMMYKEWPRVFPKHRNQCYHYPTIRMNWKTTPYELKEWVKGIDEIIDSRGVLGKRKGLIHTVSYDRQDYLFTHSRHRKLFLGNTADPNSETAAEVVKRFRKSKAPTLLVSPSFSTGWDFPGTDCEYIIIGKVPWPVTKGKVIKERIKRDPQYATAIAMQELVQMAGRGMRFMEDRCEIFIVDDGIGFFMAQGKSHAPAWFEVRRLAKGPENLPKLPPKL